MKSQVPYQAAVLASLLLLPWQTGDAAFAQEEIAKYFVGPISGTAMDEEGKPVSNAKVRLIGGKRDEDPVVLHETTTDSEGRFQIAERQQEYVPRVSRPHSIVIQDARGRVGGTSRIPLRSASSRPLDLQVTLHDTKQYRGRLADAAGAPVVKAGIKLMRWADAGMGEQISESLEWPGDLIGQSAVETAEDGSFVLHSLPAAGYITAVITTQDFGSPQVRFSLANPVTIRLDKPGSIRGKVTAEGKLGGVAGVDLYLSASPESVRVSDGDYYVYCVAEGSSDSKGAFRFDGVPPGKYAIRPRLDQNAPHIVAATPMAEVAAGKETSASVVLGRAIAVNGKVVDRKTGAGIKDVSLFFRQLDSRGGTDWSRSVTTDADGAFTVHVKPGKIAANVFRVPENYISPSPIRGETPIEVAKETTWPTIRLAPAAVVHGVVADDAGKPVADAEIRVLTPDHYFDRGNVQSDQAGKFTLKRGAANDALSIRVRTSNAVSDGPVVVVPKTTKGPVKIVVSEKKAFALRGTLVDSAGQPIPKAEVHLHTMWRVAGGAIGFRMSSGATDERGTFEFRALWPGDEYNVRAEAEGYEKHESVRVTGVAGETHDFSQIVLTSARGVVEGRVTDSAGKPLAHVQVFNVGDAPKALAATTDEQGRYRLQGFLAGRVYVFAKRPEYRFTGVSAESGDTDVEIRLLRKDEPAPARPQPDYPSFEEQQQIAREVLERLWRERNRKEMSKAIVAMARIDPQQAMEWSEQVGGTYQRTIRSIAAVNIAKSDLDEALALLAPEGRGAFNAMKGLAEQLACSHADKAMRCIEEAAVLARNADQPWRAIYLSQAGRLVMRLGNQAGGRKLVEEAAVMVQGMGAGESQRRACSGVAKAVAAFDPERAVKLLGLIKAPRDRSRHLVTVAVALAPQDLDRAQELLKDAQTWDADRAIAPIAYHLALTRPDDALHFIEKAAAEGRGYGEDWGTKAEALSLAAVAIAPRDKTRACELIDQALDLCIGPREERHMSLSYGGRPAHAALLAVRAEQVGYPDMESIVHRVLASRTTSDEAHSPTWRVELNAAMAMILALVDPHAARDVLELLEPRSEGVGSGGTGFGRDEWSTAWALADPRGVPDRVERELASNEDKPDWNASRSPIWDMLEILATPPSDRLKDLTERMSGVWMPGDEL